MRCLKKTIYDLDKISQVCTTWYLVGFWYDLETGQVVSTEILDQWNTCESGAPPEGYGESPEPPLEEDCSSSGPAGLSDMISSSTPDNELLGISLLAGTSDTRTKKYEWKIRKGLGWYIFSFDKGVHRKVANQNTNLQWEWETLTHENLSLVGVVLGGSIEYNTLYSNADVGVYIAKMNLTFKCKYSFICKGSPISSELV